MVEVLPGRPEGEDFFSGDTLSIVENQDEVDAAGSESVINAQAY
jgi:hypothetical protein